MTDDRRQTITVDSLSKRYGDVLAVDDLSFSIYAGEIVGFLGPNGAGKTTTMKILTGALAATSGSATVAGFDVQDQRQEVRQHIGYLPEDVPLYDPMLFIDYLSFIADLRHIDADEKEQRIHHIAHQTGLLPMLGRSIDELSKGYRQRVGLAQAILHDPPVIILDEPTTGLDPNQIIDIRDVITTFGEEQTVILSTHILQEVSAVCDRILIIDAGRLVADGTLQELADQHPDDQPSLEDIFRFFTTEDRHG